MNFQQPHQLTPEELADAQLDFPMLLEDSARLEDVYQSLHTFFSEVKFDTKTVGQYYHTYWSWYVQATWRLNLSLPVDTFVEHLAYQLPKAFSLGIAVEDEFLYFLFRKFPIQVYCMPVYKIMQQKILQSTFPLHPNVNNGFTIKDVAAQYKKLTDAQTDSLEMAAFLAKVAEQLFLNFSDKQIENGEKNGQTKDFLSFLLFLQTDIDITEVVTKHIINITAANLPKPNPVLLEAEKREENSQNEDILSDLPMELTQPSSTAPAPEEAPLTFDGIKNMVDAQFEKDDTGQYKDIEAVFGLLDQLSEEYNDPKIKELLYFDENSGGFVWMEG